MAAINPDIDVYELGNILYEKALIKSSDEPITDPRGHSIGWLLDTRMPMLEGPVFRAVGNVIAGRLRDRGIEQVAGYGFGAFPIVSSVISSSEGPDLNGGFIREVRKKHGRKRLIEGPLTKKLPVVLVDDILNSGRSAIKAVTLMRDAGYQVVGILTLFHFSWGGGRQRLISEGLWVESLLDLTLKNSQSSNSDGAKGLPEK